MIERQLKALVEASDACLNASIMHLYDYNTGLKTLLDGGEADRRFLFL